MSCGAEMRVLGVAHDDTAGIAGYVRQTLECPACREVETRTTLRRAHAPAQADAPLQPSAPPQPSAAPQASGFPPGGLSPPPAAAVSPASALPSSSGPPLEDPFEQAGLLLQRAIEMVRGPLHPAQSPKGLTDGLPEPPPPPTPLADVPDEIDEGEALLRRAIEMVRGAARDPAAKAAGLLTASPAASAKPARVKRSPPGRIVRICHDPTFDAVYAAKDTTSGLVVIRHQDSTRLRAMCERLGWQVIDQVIDNAAPTAEPL
jgi:hypothetical protein